MTTTTLTAEYMGLFVVVDGVVVFWCVSVCDLYLNPISSTSQDLALMQGPYFSTACACVSFHVRQSDARLFFHYHVPKQTHEPSNSALRALSGGDESRVCAAERNVARTKLPIDGDIRLLVFKDSSALLWP